jgi:hypothetical protein
MSIGGVGSSGGGGRGGFLSRLVFFPPDGSRCSFPLSESDSASEEFPLREEEADAKEEETTAAAEAAEVAGASCGGEDDGREEYGRESGGSCGGGCGDDIKRKRWGVEEREGEGERERERKDGGNVGCAKNDDVFLSLTLSHSLFSITQVSPRQT